MPPPRLPRHLRPCHPLGTAHQVRCASWTGRNSTTATGGRDVSHLPRAAGNNKASVETQQHATPTAGRSDHSPFTSTPAPAETASTAAPSPSPSPAPPAEKGSWWSSVLRRLTSGPVATPQPPAPAPTQDTATQPHASAQRAAAGHAQHQSNTRNAGPEVHGQEPHSVEAKAAEAAKAGKSSSSQTTPVIRKVTASSMRSTNFSNAKVRPANVDRIELTKTKATPPVPLHKFVSERGFTNPRNQRETTKKTRDQLHRLRDDPATDIPPSSSVNKAAASSKKKVSELAHKTKSVPTAQGATGHLQDAVKLPSPSDETGLTENLSAMQSSLSELQNQVEKLHSAIERISTASITEAPKPRPTASVPQVTHKPLKSLNSRQHLPVLVPSPRLAGLQKAWVRYRGKEQDLATQSRGHPVLYPRWNNSDGPRKHQNPTHRTLMLMWRKYRRYDGDIVKLTQPLIDSFPKAPSGRSISKAHLSGSARESGSQHSDRKARESKNTVQSTSLEAVRHFVDNKGISDAAPTKIYSQTKNFGSKENADQNVNIIAPGKPSGQNKDLGANHAKSISSLLNANMSEQSLLEELFPEATSTQPPAAPIDTKRDQYPKLEPPAAPQPSRLSIEQKKTLSKAERFKQKQAELVESFQKNMEDITVLQLAYCSTKLTETDFMRLIPKGQHIEGWRRGGEFFRIIPGRDPLSLERMPFYYLLFKRTEAALAYQNNVARLHKLNALHQPTNILSAVPAPKGFLEDGEDLSSTIMSYNLAPAQQDLYLITLMQPYSPALRALIERGGYSPIVPDVDEQGQRIWKVLMHIEGYEPTPSDLFKIFTADAWKHGMQLPLRTESMGSIHRLRDIVNLKTTSKPISSVHPRAYGTADHTKAASQTQFEDPAIQSMMAGVEEESGIKELNQYVMNRVYNRWVIEFDDESAARRFAINWHRRVLPAPALSKGAWEDTEEVRMCNTEVLW